MEAVTFGGRNRHDTRRIAWQNKDSSKIPIAKTKTTNDTGIEFRTGKKRKYGYASAND